MKIVIIDDDNFVAISLKTILETNEDIQVLAMGNSGKEAIDLYQLHHPDILLMDIRMDEMSGLEAGSIILASNPNAKILFLTTFSDDEYIIKAIHMGAKGYILKQEFEGIAPALRSVFNYQTVFGREVIHKLPDMIQTKNSLDYATLGLSSREYDVLYYVAMGLNNKEIASTLFLSEGTVRNYLSTILEKLQLRDRTQLAVFYYKNFN